MPPRRTLVLLLAAALLTQAPGAFAASPAPRKKTVRVKPAPQHDNGEQPRDRERRLARECRSQPNAGACAGYGWGS